MKYYKGYLLVYSGVKYIIVSNGIELTKPLGLPDCIYLINNVFKRRTNA